MSRPRNFLAALILLVGGCVQYEEAEQRIEIDTGSTGSEWIARSTITLRGLQSTASLGEEDYETDFQSVIADWKGDEYLVNAADNGHHVLSRRVWVEKDRLDMEIRMISRLNRAMDPESGWKADLQGFWFNFDRQESILVMTNGLMTTTDSAVTSGRWPLTTPELVVRQKFLELLGASGVVTAADSAVTIVHWPLTAPELVVRQEFLPVESNPDFVNSFRAYLREEERRK